MLFQFATCQRIYDDVTLKVKLKKTGPNCLRRKSGGLEIKPENNCQQKAEQKLQL